MQRVNHELQILARSVAYKNLSGAAQHVGLSQPQLSRIVKRIEENFSIILLDRSSKRTSSWTPIAYRLAELYAKRMRVLDQELEILIGNAQTHQLQVGTLEGLSKIALQTIHGLFQNAGVKIIEVDVYDLDRLEELFLRGDLDLIFSSREPGRKKYRNYREVGFQSLEQMNSNEKYEVVSTFEFGARKEKSVKSEKVLVSNSLGIRKEWFLSFGGVGTLPSEVKKVKSSKLDTEKVIILGSDTLSPLMWEHIEKIAI